MTPRAGLCLLLAAAALTACAPEVHRIAIAPPSPASSASNPDTIELASPAELKIETGYNRTLAAGSRWRFAGMIANGAVYRAAQSVFTLEGANIHEAYLVLRDDELVGFYLPVEQAYSPLQKTVRLSIRNH